MNEEGGQASGVEVPLENAPLLQPASSSNESTPEELQPNATVEEGASHEQAGSAVQGASATSQEGASSAPVQVKCRITVCLCSEFYPVPVKFRVPGVSFESVQESTSSLTLNFCCVYRSL